MRKVIVPWQNQENSGIWSTVEKEAFNTSIEENGFTKLTIKDGSGQIVADAVKTRSLKQAIDRWVNQDYN